MSLRRIRINTESFNPSIHIITDKDIPIIDSFLNKHNLRTMNMVEYLNNSSLYAYNNGVIGVCLVVLDSINKIITINQLYVDSIFHRQGIGRKLLNKIIEINNDYERIELSVIKSNTKAINFYKNLGFKEYGSSGNSIGYIEMYMNI